MIPLRDTILSRYYPVANMLLIVVNVIFYMVEKAQGENLNRFILPTALFPCGMGKKIDDNHRGDFYITVRITNN